MVSSVQRGRAIEVLFPRVSFRRELGAFDVTMVVIGGIIGAGIFINPTFVARQLDSTTLVLSAWVAGGCVALAGAFAYAELAQRLPNEELQEKFGEILKRLAKEHAL